MLLQLTSESRVTLDPESGAIRTWFDMPTSRTAASPFDPQKLARRALEEGADLFKWWPNLENLRNRAIIRGEKSFSVRFIQEFRGVPVDSSEVVVNMYDDGRLYSIYNNYHYHIPEELNPEKAVFKARQAKGLAEQLLQVYRNYEVSEPTLVVYQYQPSQPFPPQSFEKSTELQRKFLSAVAANICEGKPEDIYEAGQYFLTWDMVATTQNPGHAWRILVDAMTNRVITVTDLLQYVRGTSQIFDPNPIERFQDYVQTDLGLANVANFPVSLETCGENSSHYNPLNKNLTLAENSLSDAYVILYEYGQALQDAVNPGFAHASRGGVSEGFGDFLASTYYDGEPVNVSVKDDAPIFRNPSMRDSFETEKRHNNNGLFDAPEFTSTDQHERAQLWSATLFELYRKLGGDSAYPGTKRAAKDLAIRLHLMANFNIPSSATTPAQMAQQIEAADNNLGGWRYADGLHRKVIYDTFCQRHLPGFPNKAVDVYINDGREGSYGSASGNDLFNEKLWQENYWDTQDIWVKTTPYTSATAQAAGSAEDHVEPVIGSTAYLYVRVKNRGANAAGSGQVTVKAFHTLPGIGLVWPDAWTPMDTPSINVSNILPGTGNSIVVGPFPWTPDTVGHQCVLVIAECAKDRALTQDIAVTNHVLHSDLVSFDNNIAQRNLTPIPAKGSKTCGFYVNNPYPEVQTISLHFENSLPDGWLWRTNLAVDQIRLGPLERRWVELIIDQIGGQEVTDFDTPHRLTVTGAINDRVIGGMTFYLAPPGADGELIKYEFTGSSNLCLTIPLPQYDGEGEIEITIRFHKKQ